MNCHYVAGGGEDDEEDDYQVHYGDNDSDDEDDDDEGDDGEMDHGLTIKDCHVLHNWKVCQRKVRPMRGDPSKVGQVNHLLVIFTKLLLKCISVLTVSIL